MRSKLFYLFSVMRYGLQDRTQRLETDSDIEQMSGEEEIVEVTKDREDEIP